MSRVLGKASAPASPAAQAAAKEQRRRGRFRAAKRLARFNAWLFGPKLVEGKWVKGDRIGTCGRKLVGRGDDAPKYPGLKRLADGDGRVTWRGIETCGSVWACLACAAKIVAARAQEIDFLAKAHIAAGGSCTFVTFTLPHIASDDLETLWRAVQRAWRKMVSGSSYQAIKARYGMLGSNGCHPHLHVLFFHDAALHGNDGTLEEFRDTLGARWGRYIEAELGRQVHKLYGRRRGLRPGSRRRTTNRADDHRGRRRRTTRHAMGHPSTRRRRTLGLTSSQHEHSPHPNQGHECATSSRKGGTLL